MKKLKVLQSYSQRDSRWGNILLGYNTNLPYTIGNFGCLITCLANYVGKTPTEINNTLKANNGFVSGGLFVWGKSTTIGLTQTYVSPFYSDAVSTYGLNKMRELIDNGYPLLTEVDFYPSTINEDMHFVLVIGYDDNDIFYALDPWTGTEIDLALYGGVKRAVYQFRAYDKKLDFINSETENNMIDPNIQKKASGFDRIWHAFNYNDITPEEAEEKDHLEFVAWIKNNIERAGKWDKLCIKAGINDSSSADFEQLYEVIFKKGENLNSNLATKVLLLEEERDRALQRQMEEAEKATKADELRAKWKSLYDTKKSEADIAKQGLATCSKNLTECQKEHELTWGDLILKVWNKIKGVKV